MRGLEAYLMGIVFGGRTNLSARLIRTGLTGLSFLYTVLLKSYRSLYRLGLLRQMRLPVPVIGVGNITVGGTGKTTTVRYLADFFCKKGFKVAILSCGYRSIRNEGIVSDGRQIRMDTDSSGDEPQMLARMLPGVAVIIGKRRTESGLIAVSQLGCDLILLDDGFQYWRLFKDYELLLIDATNPFSNRWPIPRGLLREPLSHLGRADAFLITNIDHVSEEKLDTIRRYLKSCFPKKTIAEVMRMHDRLRNLQDERSESTGWLKGRQVGALSTIGNPLPFEEDLRRYCAAEVISFRYPDHHRYTQDEIQALLRQAGDLKLEAIVTTEKDAVKISKEWLSHPSVWALDASLKIVRGGEALKEGLLKKIKQRF